MTSTFILSSLSAAVLLCGCFQKPTVVFHAHRDGQEGLTIYEPKDNSYPVFASDGTDTSKDKTVAIYLPDGSTSIALRLQITGGSCEQITVDQTTPADVSLTISGQSLSFMPIIPSSPCPGP